jgi:hypothetical protein
MTIADCRENDTIETLRDGVPTWNVYKIVRADNSGRIPAWREHRQGKTWLHPSCPCRIVKTDYPF